MIMRIKSYIPLLPFIAVIVFILYGCMFINLLGSISDWSGRWPDLIFQGFRYYGEVVQHRMFIQATTNTLTMIAVALPTVLGLGLLTAILLDLKPKGEKYIRVLILLPFAIATVVSAIFWGWMFDPSYGTINTILGQLGLGSLQLGWTSDPNLVVYCVIIVIIWKYAGYVGIIFLGGIKSVPMDHINSARVFGASNWQMYKKVIIPQLKGTAMTAALIVTMFSIKCFGLVWVLTGGGPGIASYVYPVLIYRSAFKLDKFSFSAAAAILMFIITIGIAAIYLYSTRRGGKR